MKEDAAVIDWLLEGDPAIRWQVMRDLLDEPPAVWEEERRRTLEHGWVAELLSHRGADSEWPAGRRRATTWTLLLLIALGVPERHPAARPALQRLIDRFIPPEKDVDGAALLKRVDLCHLGFWLGLAAYFLDPDDPRLLPLAEAVLSAQFADGGWNCHMRNHAHRTHSSFHTTSARERPRRRRPEAVPAATFRDAQARAAELMLAHCLFPLGSHHESLHPVDDRLRSLPEELDPRRLQARVPLFGFGEGEEP